MEHEWLLKRNCSLSPTQAMWAFGSLCALLLLVGSVFALVGAWPVLGFAVLNIGALVLALLRYARHAGDHERIALTPECLLIEITRGSDVQLVCLDPCWTRIVAPSPSGGKGLIRLEARGTAVDIGIFVGESTREQVARDLRRCLGERSYLLQGRG